MKTKNNYIIIQKKKLQSESGIVRGQPKNIGVVIEKNSQTEVGDLIVYKSSFIFHFLHYIHQQIQVHLNQQMLFF